MQRKGKCPQILDAGFRVYGVGCLLGFSTIELQAPVLYNMQLYE